MSDEWTQIDLNKGKNTEIASVPEIIEGKWKDTEGNEITSARINDTVVLYIKTKNL